MEKLIDAYILATLGLLAGSFVAWSHRKDKDRIAFLYGLSIALGCGLYFIVKIIQGK